MRWVNIHASIFLLILRHFRRALQTPQILELSGIGRRDVLEKIGVPVKLELPGVGENLQEHFSSRLVHRMCVFSGLHRHRPLMLLPEIHEDHKQETIDLLRDPELAKKHLELQ